MAEVTHGIRHAWREDGAVSRSMTIHLLDDGYYMLHIETKLTADSEPIQTSLLLSKASIHMLYSTLDVAAHHMHLYPVVVSDPAPPECEK